VVASVIVPTLNRADSVTRTVRSLLAQKVANAALDIIVVDNGSSDGTFERVSLLADHAPCAFRVLREPNLGLHNARHAGALAASGEVLLFTDDDATFSPRWVESYVTAFQQHPEMAAAGGPIEPAWEATPPDWLIRYMIGKDDFGILSLRVARDEFALRKNGDFYGVNMAIRRDVLFEAGGFNPEAYGSTWLGDGETGLTRKLWRAGRLIGWVPQARVFHHIPPGRMTLQYFRRRLQNEGACDIYTWYHRTPAHAGKLLGEFTKTLVFGVFPWLRASLQWRRTSRRAIDAQLEAARYLGRLQYLWRVVTNPEMKRILARTNWINQTERPASEQAAR
jgi:glycosyltransferase involved in cell wall biosynthesis